MSHKAKESTLQSPKTKANGRSMPYPSLAKAPPPAERLAKFLKTTVGQEVKAMTESELEKWLSTFPNLWPDETEIDEIVTWLHKARREGR
jgi:hypothetical protein